MKKRNYKELFNQLTEEQQLLIEEAVQSYMFLWTFIKHNSIFDEKKKDEAKKRYEQKLIRKFAETDKPEQIESEIKKEVEQPTLEERVEEQIAECKKIVAPYFDVKNYKENYKTAKQIIERLWNKETAHEEALKLINLCQKRADVLKGSTKPEFLGNRIILVDNRVTKKIERIDTHARYHDYNTGEYFNKKLKTIYSYREFVWQNHPIFIHVIKDTTRCGQKANVSTKAMMLKTLDKWYKERERYDTTVR